MKEFFIGIIIGIVYVLIGYRILYSVFWYNFKKIGKKYNLITIRCKKCKNYFYIFRFETTKLCCNCIALGIAKNEIL